jgi:PAS domain S-box-containing protein
MTTASRTSRFKWLLNLWVNPWARLIVFALVYFAATQIGSMFTVWPEGIAMIWPASGVALAILLLRPKREWWGLLAMIFIVNLASDLFSRKAIAISAGYAFANVMGAAACGWAMSRLRREPVTFTRLGDVLALIFVSTFVNALTTSLGALVPVLGFGAQYFDVWLIWLIADGLGLLAVTPLIVLWIRGGSIMDRQPVARRFESILWLIVLGVSTWFMFGASKVGIRLDTRPYMLFPLLIWAALRFSPRAAATGLIMLSVIALGSTAAGLGTFPLGGNSLLNRLLTVQAFCCVACITTMLLTVSFMERRQAEAEIRQSEKRFRSMIENGGDAITLIGADGKVLYEGPTVERITGYTARERIGKNGFETIHPDDLPALRDVFVSITANPGVSKTTEFRATRKDGTVWWAEGTATNMLNEPSVQAIVINYRDVTERKRAEAEREHLLQELERKNKEMESLLYIASHDLRSPLVNIQGFGKNLQKYFSQVSDILGITSTLEEFRSSTQPILSERIPAALRFIETSSIKMDSLIDGLLRLSRVGRISYQMGPVDMTRMIQGILDTMAFQIEKAHARIEMDQPLAECFGDWNQVNQVFSNLIDNAIKYHAPDRPLVITISSRVGPNMVTYTVADTGLGIASEDQSRIWELFRRIDNSNEIPGEGLGLTIARRIIERHNGRIWLESELGFGSRFHVELPARN